MNHLIQYAMQFVGVPYKWGGANPIEGLDCSGLVQLILAAAGIDPPGDQTAQGLYNYFEKYGARNAWAAGALAFFGKDVNHVTHVAFCINPYQMIEAGGGGSQILTREDAAKHGAFVRMRHIQSRPDLIAVIKPNYARIGLIP